MILKIELFIIGNLFYLVIVLLILSQDEKKTDHVTRIESLRNRGEFDSFYWATGRLNNLSEFINSHSGKSDLSEVLKYVPIACVACFEGVSRLFIKELIDSGNPYLERSAKLVSKFDFTIFNDISKKQFTIGEFVGHSLSCNKLEDINANFSVILDTDFLEKLSLHSRVSYDTLKNEGFKYFNENSGLIYQEIKKIFELRHVFCHELAYHTQVTSNDAKIFLDVSTKFIEQLEDFINDVRGISYEKMLPEQIEDLRRELDESDTLAGEYIDAVRKMEDHNNPEEFKESFEHFLDAWNNYAFAKAEWERSFPFSGNYQTYAKLQSFVKSNYELVDLLRGVK